MRSMTAATQSITTATHNIQADMARMNHNIGRPMSFMNTFMPW